MAARVLRVEILGEARKLNTTLSQVDGRLSRFGKTSERVGRATAALFAGGAIVQGIRTVTRAAQEAAAVGRQTDAVIKSTGGAAGLSSKGFATLATQISKTAAVDDDLVQGGENILATFTKIKAGGPDKIFERAEQAAVDMAAAMGHGEVTAEGLQTANVQLGKALNDPIKGMTALQKVGVTFSAQQRQQIADFVKHGQLAKAQGVILAEVNKEFGGSAAAAATEGKRFSVAVGNLEESLGGALLPTMERGAAVAAGMAEGFTSLDKATGGLASKALLGAAGIAGIGFAAGKTLKFVNESKTAWAALRAAKLANAVAAPAVVAAETATGGAAAGSGAAAATAATRWTALAGAVARFAIPAALVVGTLAALKQEHDRYNTQLARTGDLTDAQRDKALSGIGPGGYIIGTRDAVKAATQAWQAYNASQLDNAKTIPPLTDRTNVLGSQLDRVGGSLANVSLKSHGVTVSYRDQVDANKKLHDSLLATRDSILSQADAFDHGRAASKVKTSSVLADLAREVKTLQTWASDAQTLIRRGMDPAAVKFLSDKGPQYLHAFATGSDKQVAGFERLFKGRMKASGDVAFNTTVGAAEAFRRMVVKANAETARIKAAKARVEGREQAAREMRRFRNEANVALGGIKNRKVSVKVTGSLSGFGAVGGAALTAKAHGRAQGGLIRGSGSGTSDTAGLFALSDYEMVIPAANVRASGGPRAVASLVGMRRLPVVRGGGLATGGVVSVGAAGDSGPIQRGARNTSAQIDRLVAAAAKLIRAAGAMVGGGPLPGGGGAGAALARKVAVWTASTFHRSGEAAAWYRRLMMESGGNPRAINRWDSNWAAGHPSVGIAQVIRGTFAANAGPYRGTGPFAYGVSMHPYANSYAGGHYAIGRYGSLRAVDPRIKRGGYDSGYGVLPPGLSLSWNGTGRPEPLRPARQQVAAHSHDIYLDGRKVGEALAPHNRQAQIRLARL